MSLKVWVVCKKGNQEGRIKLNRMNSEVQESISTKQESFKFWKHDPRETNKQEPKLQQALSKRKLQRAKVGFQEQTLKDLKINNKIFLRYIRNKRPTTEFVQAKGAAKEDNNAAWKINDFPLWHPAFLFNTFRRLLLSIFFSWH